MRLRRNPLKPWAAISIVVFSSASVMAQTPLGPPQGLGAAFDFSQGSSGPNAPPRVFDYGADVGIGETDNVNLTPSNKISQTIATADVDFDLEQQTRRLQVAAKGDFTDLDYLQGAYGNQLLGRFDGIANVGLWPEHVVWAVRDDFGQVGLDPYTPVTPGNIEDVNYFSTGPDLLLRFGATSFLDVDLRYARAQYQTSDFDSNRLIGNLAWGLNVSSRSTLSLNAATERVMFEDTEANPDFDRTRAYVRYELQGARTQIAADLGASLISRSGTSTSGSLAKLELSRRLTAASKLTLSAGRELTDPSSSFSTLQSGASGIIGVGSAPQTAQSYNVDFASAGWQYARHRTTLALSFQWEKDEYLNQPQYNLERVGGEFRVSRRLTRRLTAQLFGRLYRNDYPNVQLTAASGSSNYTNLIAGGDLQWRTGRTLVVDFKYNYNAWVVAAPGNGYRANELFVTVGYRPHRAVNEPQEEPESRGTL